MKRADLMRAIALGICADKELTKKEQRALCAVGLKAEKVRIGGFGGRPGRETGCPLAQAGMRPEGMGWDERTKHLAFASAFDRATGLTANMPFGGIVVEIEDD